MMGVKVMSSQSSELSEGASADAERAVVNGAASVSAVPASIPSASYVDRAARVLRDMGFSGDCYIAARRIYSIAAQAIEARSGETERLDPQGESAVANGDAS